MIDYITCLGLFYPNVFAVCRGDSTSYSDIEVESGDPLPPQSELDQKIFQHYQVTNITALSTICEEVIMAGFTSNALGSIFAYASQTLDQINLIGSIIASQPNILAPEG